MRWFASFFIISLLLCSCDKESYCKQNRVIGQYNNLGEEDDLFVGADYHGNLQTHLPRIIGPGFHNFYTDVEIVQAGCSFELKGLYDNFADGHDKPHYWLSGEGNGHFEKKKLYLDYHYTVTETSEWSPDKVLTDTSFSYEYEKL